MNAMSLHSVFSTLLTRYRQQVTDLDAADDQDDIDRLVNASQDTLSELAGTRPRSAAAMADKVQELIRRYDAFGALPMDLVRELLADTYHLASESGLTLAWGASVERPRGLDHRPGRGARLPWPTRAVAGDRYVHGQSAGRIQALQRGGSRGCV